MHMANIVRMYVPIGKVCPMHTSNGNGDISIVISNEMHAGIL